MSTRSSSPLAAPLPRAPLDDPREGAPAAPDARYRRGKLDAFAHLMGTMPDADVARLARSSVAGVKAHRARHGIPRWVGETAGRRPAERVIPSDRRGLADAASAGAASASGLGTRAVAAVTAGLAAGALQRATPARPWRAFVAEATGPSGGARVVVTGPDIVSAARSAVAVLAVRPGGPWALHALCDLGDAG